MNKKVKEPKYLKDLVKQFPKITSGRKNFSQHHGRILKTLYLIKKYIKKRHGSASSTYILKQTIFRVKTNDFTGFIWKNKRFVDESENGKV